MTAPASSLRGAGRQRGQEKPQETRGNSTSAQAQQSLVPGKPKPVKPRPHLLHSTRGEAERRGPLRPWRIFPPAPSQAPPEERRWRLGHPPGSTEDERSDKAASCGHVPTGGQRRGEGSGGAMGQPHRAERGDGLGGTGRPGMLGRLPGRARAAGRGGTAPDAAPQRPPATTGSARGNSIRVAT